MTNDQVTQHTIVRQETKVIANERFYQFMCQYLIKNKCQQKVQRGQINYGSSDRNTKSSCNSLVCIKQSTRS